MIVFLDTSHDMHECQEELGAPVEQLLTPLSRFERQYADEHFAIDNGAFSRFDRTSFESLLEREKNAKHLCRFVAAPDVVGSARRTLELFEYWYPRIAGRWPVAFVAQDGQQDLPIPWHLLDVIFIGGTTAFKMSAAAVEIIKCAQGLGKWVHVGRVNTPGRFEYFEWLGVDSIDGTGLARYTHMREAIYRAHTMPSLLDEMELQLTTK
jgi:hypothetical protein